MIIPIENTEIILTPEQKETHYWQNWIYNSHRWKEYEGGYYECSFCEKIHTSTTPLQYSKLCEKNPHLNISDVRNSIQERIKRHKDYINSSLELIKNENRPTDVILTLTDEIRRIKIRISELEGVLESC
jgi:tRNA G26 N,N-dimethylase Trm1